MKVAVYTIALNEAANARRWADSATEAEYRVVADTGSTDGTAEILGAAGVIVHRITIRPWRFDDARNAALALLPDDVDVCLTMDMDESLTPGWRPKLEASWDEGLTGLYCRLEKRSDPASPAYAAWPAKKFHRRWGYRFRHPVHESLHYVSGEEVTRVNTDIVIHHIQDHGKETRRQYLPLMEVAHREAPADPQIAFWFGRELCWAGEHARAAAVLKHYLALPESRWAEERAEAMRFLARTEPENAVGWLDRARIEAPHRREVWHDLAERLHDRGDWLNLFWACANGILKTHRTGSYLDDNHAWGFRLYDLGAIAAWHLNVMDRAVEWGSKALELDPGNQRLQNNLAFFERRRGEVYRAGEA